MRIAGTAIAREAGHAMLKIDVIIPVFNEGRNIKRTLDSLAANVKNIEAHFNVNIIYDMEEDDTLPVVRDIRGGYPYAIVLVKNEKSGACNAIKRGLRDSSADFMLVTMADMSDDYSALPMMVDKAREGYDIVCASRYMKGGKLYGGPFLKQAMSRVSGISLHFLRRIPTHDITNSYKLYRARIIRMIEIESTGGFEIGMEITAKAYLAGAKITEIPTRWWDRTQGESRFALMKWLPRYLKWYFFLLLGRRTPVGRHEEHAV